MEPAYEDGSVVEEGDCFALLAEVADVAVEDGVFVV